MIQKKKSKCREQVEAYIREHDPYEKLPCLGYNIPAMSRYARNKNIPISKLTEQEAKMFITKS